MVEKPRRREAAPETTSQNRGGVVAPREVEPLPTTKAKTTSLSDEERTAAEIEELQAALSIQLHRLHEQAAEQPECYRRVSELYAEAKTFAAIASLEEGEKKAEIGLLVRKTPSNFGLDKITETAAANVVTGHHEVQAAARKTIEAHRKAEILRGLTTAFDQRRSMLDMETRLFSSNYWGTEGATPSPTEAEIMRQRRNG